MLKLSDHLLRLDAGLQRHKCVVDHRGHLALKGEQVLLEDPIFLSEEAELLGKCGLEVLGLVELFFDAGKKTTIQLHGGGVLVFDHKMPLALLLKLQDLLLRFSKLDLSPDKFLLNFRMIGCLCLIE